MAAPVIGTRLRYPPNAAKVDPTHSLAARLEFCFVPSINDVVELAKGYRATRNGTIQRGATDIGQGAYLSSGTTYYSFAGVPDGPFLGPLTLLWVGCTRQAAGTYSFIANKGGTSNLNMPFALYGDNSTPRKWDGYRSNGSTAIGIATANVPFPTNELQTFISTWTASPTDGASLYINGARYTVAGSGSGSYTGTGANLNIGARPADSLNSNTVVNIFAAWSRRISEAEVQMLYANPFCFLRY